MQELVAWLLTKTEGEDTGRVWREVHFFQLVPHFVSPSDQVSFPLALFLYH